MPRSNVDDGPPANPLSDGIPLANEYIHDGSIPIFWGNNQKINEETLAYDKPSGHVDDATLHIPKVCRFLYTFTDAVEDGENPEPWWWKSLEEDEDLNSRKFVVTPEPDGSPDYLGGHCDTAPAPDIGMVINVPPGQHPCDYPFT